MSTGIVIVNVSVTSAPIPNKLQSTGAFISQGGTTLASSTYGLITQMSDLTAILAAPLNITSLAWSANVVTVTATAPHGITVGDTFLTTISGAAPTAYNGTYLATSTTSTEFTYALAVNPGAETTPGTFTGRNSAELVAMATTFFAQGASQAVYVLELGAGEPAAGVTTLTNFINDNPQVFYSYLVPASWDGVSPFLAFLADYEEPTAKTYFYVTTTTGTYTSYTAQMKCVKAMIQAPSAPTIEFSHAADFQHDLNYAPSTTNRVTPNQYCYLYGVTPYPTTGNASLIATLKAASVNIVGTGAEGGITNTLLLWGTLMDGNQFTFWYSADWIQINIDLDVANAIINGSNNPLNPLYYNQQGINRLQEVAANTVSDAISFGLAIGTVTMTPLTGTAFGNALDADTFAGQNVVNAVPFLIYTQQNPGNYKLGIYGGLSVLYLPALGFTQIIFNVNVSQLPGTQ